MLCDICKKNEATIHIKEMHNNKWTSINLCAECAKMNELKETGEIGIDLAQMFLELGKAAKKQQENAEKNAPAEEQKDDMPPCPICSWTQSDIRKNNGKFGCPVCYTHYKEMAEQTFRSIQKGPAHIGKHAAGINEHDLLQAVDVAVEMVKNGDNGIPVPNYVDENVSTKIVKLIQSYTGVVNKMVWRKE